MTVFDIALLYRDTLRSEQILLNGLADIHWLGRVALEP
jgi:hypothetical protein